MEFVKYSLIQCMVDADCLWKNISQDLEVRLSHIISGSVVSYFHYADLYPNQKVKCPVLVLTLRSSGADPLKEFSNLPHSRTGDPDHIS